MIAFGSREERARLRQAQQELAQQRLMARVQSRSAGRVGTKPFAYERPAFNTPEYWRDCSHGWISDDEQRADQADYETRRKRAVDSKHSRAPAPHRHQRPGPRPSNQFSKCMSTQAARDDRLTPQSKALLQVIVARTGKGLSTDTTKTTLGVIMNRCPRSIQRYLAELVKFGYLRTQTIKSRRTGFYVGLRIWIMNRVLPFFSRKGRAFEPEAWHNPLARRRNREETKEPLTKDKDIIRRVLSPTKPPWFPEYAYRIEGSG